MSLKTFLILNSLLRYFYQEKNKRYQEKIKRYQEKKYFFAVSFSLW